RENAMQAATCVGSTVLAAFLALAGPRAALAITPDAWITTRAKMALLATDGLRRATINVDTMNGRVTLHGRVRTADEKAKAGDAARVPGVRRVASEIESPNELTAEEIGRDSMPLAREDRGMTDAARDILITSATKLRLLADSRTPALEINVDTTDGDLTLFGMVPSNEAKAAAEEDARGVSGVKRVVNLLQVVHPAKQEAVKANDQALERDIKAALAGRPDLSDSRIAVEVKNGVARLSGTVPSQEERLAAALTARAAVGVKSVEDDLRVS